MKKLIFFLLTLIFIGCSSNEKIETTIQDRVTEDVMTSAILLDDSSKVEELLNDGYPIESIDSRGRSLLIRATSNNSIGVMRVLLDRGANPNNGISSLDQVDDEKGSKEKLSTIYNKGDLGKTPLYFVKSKEALELLIDYNAQLDYTNTYLGEPLIINFIKHKPYSFLEILIDSGADVTIVDKDKWTPLIWAIVNGNLNSVKKIVNSGGDIAYLDKKENYPIYYTYNKEIINYLIQDGYDLTHKNVDGENILGEVYLRCVANSYYLEVEKLINLGVNKSYSSYGESALSIANDNKDAMMTDIIKKK